MSAYNVIDIFGGDKFAFVRPSVADQYPAGAAFGALVPDSWEPTLDGSRLTSTYLLEASALVESAGARAKVALVRLDTDAVLAEITFTADQTVGETKQSASFTIPPGVRAYGIKMTTNNTLVGCAAWGGRLLRA